MSPVFPTNLLGSLEIGRRALVAHQRVLQTVGHNLANAATPGYTRQRAELVPVGPWQGVEVAALRRLRDRFLDHARWAEEEGLGGLETREGMLRRLEAVFVAPAGVGLGDLLDRLFQAFHDLSLRPADRAIRIAVRDAGTRVAETLRGLRARVDRLAADLTTEMAEQVRTANALLAELAALHRRILDLAGGPAPNDLLDRRDELVRRLARTLGVVAHDLPDGTLRLVVAGSGVLVLDGTRAAPVALQVGSGDGAVLTVGGVAVSPSGGALAALLTALNAPESPLRRAREDLDALARDLIASINRLHAAGAGLEGHTVLVAATPVDDPAAPLDAAGLAFPPRTGRLRLVVHDTAGALLSEVAVDVTAGVTALEDLRAALDADPFLAASIDDGRLRLEAAPGTTFAVAEDSSDTLLGLGLNGFFAGTDATTIALDPAVATDVGRIAAARVDAAGLVHPGDGSNALALARLVMAPVADGGRETLAGLYGALLGRVGSALGDARLALDRQRTALEVVEGLQQQVSGVSADEELVTLSQTQHAYAAAARFVQTVDELLATLLQTL